MKNLTIKTFFIFLLLSSLIMGAVYAALYIFSPYSNEKKYAAYVESEAKAAVEKSMKVTLDIYGFLLWQKPELPYGL